MTETLNTQGPNNSDDWDKMAESLSVEKSLEDGEDPEKIIQAAYEEGRLTPDFMEEYGATFAQYGLNEDKFEHYEKLSRQHGGQSPENLRRRFDEEPEQDGYESDVA